MFACLWTKEKPVIIPIKYSPSAFHYTYTNGKRLWHLRPFRVGRPVKIMKVLADVDCSIRRRPVLTISAVPYFIHCIVRKDWQALRQISTFLFHQLTTLKNVVRLVYHCYPFIVPKEVRHISTTSSCLPRFYKYASFRLIFFPKNKNSFLSQIYSLQRGFTTVCRLDSTVKKKK